jgi:hypothetical protein
MDKSLLDEDERRVDDERKKRVAAADAKERGRKAKRAKADLATSKYGGRSTSAAELVHAY